MYEMYTQIMGRYVTFMYSRGHLLQKVDGFYGETTAAVFLTREYLLVVDKYCPKFRVNKRQIDFVKRCISRGVVPNF